MKKISIILVAIMSICLLTAPVIATNSEGEDTANTINNTDSLSGEEIYKELENRNGNASLTTIKNLKTKEEKIAYYTEKCGGSSLNGNVLYYLYEFQKYSIPVCFIGLVIASLNFFIIGNKKLDKREQGFSMLIAFGLGLIVFQVLPLLFAIIVAGR